MLRQQFDEIEALCVDEWLAPGGFSAADSYALTFLRWARRIGFDVADFPNWVALGQRAVARAAVKRALEREGLGPEEFGPAPLGEPLKATVGI